MTTTLTYGTSLDGSLHNGHASYATARSGHLPALVAGATTGPIGQNSSYMALMAFVGFNFTGVPATEVATAAYVALYQGSVVSPGVARNLEIRALGWHPGGLTTSDWQDPTELAALQFFGQVTNINQAANYTVIAGSDELLTYVGQSAATEMHAVLVTSRQRAGNVPTSDETSVIYLSEASGTPYDPLLVWTTVVRSKLFPVLGAQVVLSDGSWAYLESDGAYPSVTISLKHQSLAGATTVIGTLPIGTASTQFAAMRGAQGFALVVDTSDHLYVFGKVGNADNTLAGLSYTKGVGYTWAVGTLRSGAMPSYGGAINQVAATYHGYPSGGRIMAVVGHTGDIGVSGTTGNELAWCLIDQAFMRTGTGGPFVRGSGSAIGTISQVISHGSNFNSYANEVGTGLDVATKWGSVNPSWGYVSTYSKGQEIGDNNSLGLGRYIINPAGDGLSLATHSAGLTWGVKDANSKIRVVPISSTATALVSTDSDIDWGFSYEIRQHTGTDVESVQLGHGALDDEGITGMPSAVALAYTNAWDVVYNSTENKLWIYFVSSANPLHIRRTSIDLNTYQPVRDSVLVTTMGAGLVVKTLRASRNQDITQKGLLSIGYTDAGSLLQFSAVVDTFNLAPTEPTLTVRANFDATAAAVFSWTFNDPNAPGDTQSAYEFIVEDVSDGSVDITTGKIVSAVSSRTVTAATLVNGKSYRWKVRTWDTSDVVGPWSGYGTFQTSAGGTVTITVPATDNPAGVITDDYQISWSVAGTTQASYRVILTRPGVTVSDTGWVTSTATTLLVAGMITSVQHTISVQVRNAALVTSGIATRLITPAYDTPEVPIVTLDPITSGGYMLVSVNNPPPQGDRPEVATNLVLRRRPGVEEAWTILGSCDPDGSFRDYTAAKGVTYEYTVRGYTL